MKSPAASLPSRSLRQRLLSFDGAVSAGHNPLWIFITISLIVAYLVLPPLFFIGYSSLVPPMESESQALTLRNYVEIFSSLANFKLLVWNSLVFSIGSSAWALLFGTSIAACFGCAISRPLPPQLSPSVLI